MMLKVGTWREREGNFWMPGILFLDLGPATCTHSFRKTHRAVHIRYAFSIDMLEFSKNGLSGSKENLQKEDRWRSPKLNIRKSFSHYHVCHGHRNGLIERSTPTEVKSNLHSPNTTIHVQWSSFKFLRQNVLFPPYFSLLPHLFGYSSWLTWKLTSRAIPLPWLKCKCFLAHLDP